MVQTRSSRERSLAFVAGKRSRACYSAFYCPQGVFTRHWVPELADVPDKYLQEPWTWSEGATLIPRVYPARIVDHMQAARDAKDRIYSLRRQEGHFAIARDIANKHGSRKPIYRQKRDWAKAKAARTKATRAKATLAKPGATPVNGDLFEIPTRQ